MNRFFALFFQIKMMYHLKLNNNNYEKAFIDLYNELESWL